MIKKIILLCCIGFFIACGSNKPVVRTSKSSSPSKPVVRTVRKPVEKPSNPVKPNSENSTNTTAKNEESTQILEATTRVKVTTALVLDYIEKYKEIAKKDMKEYGIPASITLAQGLLESNAGHSKLALKENNHFGIKCRAKCQGCRCANYTDDDRYDMFRIFDSPWQSFREHSKLLSSGRYKYLTKLDIKDYKNWATGLKTAGYATDKKYAEKLIAIIEYFKLDRFDQ